MVPITTLFFNFVAIFKISKVHFGTVKSIITFVFLKTFILLVEIFKPLILLLVLLFSVRQTNLKPLVFFEDLMSC